LNALGDGTADAIDLRDQIVGGDGEMTGSPAAMGASSISSSETLRVIERWAVRSDLTLEEEPLLVVEGLVGGFRGIMISGKLPKVKENPAVASIWTATLAEKKTPLLNATELAARTPEDPPTWRANCRIAIPASPPGVYPAVSFRWRISEPRDRWLRGDARVRQVRTAKVA